MPESLGVQVQGARELAAALQAAAGDPALFSQAAAAYGQTVASRARQRAPIRSGRLRAAIRASSEQNTSLVSVGVVYAGSQEFGWRTRPNRSRGWRGGPYPGRHYIYGSVDDSVQDRLDLYAQNADQVLDQIARVTPTG